MCEVVNATKDLWYAGGSQRDHHQHQEHPMTDILTVSEATTARDTAQVVLTAALRAQFANEDKGTDAAPGDHQMLVSRVRWANEDLVHAERMLYRARQHAEEQTAPARGLGERQINVLKALGGDRGRPYPTTWTYGSHSQTVSILDSLVRRGLVRKDEHDVYRITDAGRTALATLSA